MTSILVLVLIAVVVIVIANSRKPQASAATARGEGDDLLAYLLLAAALGGAAISFARLGQAAFPTGGFIFEPERQVAAALAGLVVTVPVTLYLWRRQRRRRLEQHGAAGWTMYLSLVEAGFMTAFAVNLFRLLDWLIGDGGRIYVTDLVIVLSVIVFHELTARATPPSSEGAELPRVIGSAVGLATLAIGVWILISWGLAALMPSVAESGGPGWQAGLAATLTGAPIWGYRWLRPWAGEPGPARQAWLFLVSTGAMALALATSAVVLGRSVAFLVIQPGPAAVYFSGLPYVSALLIVGLLVWAHHRWLLGTERTDPVRSYEYATAALGMVAAVGAVTSLVTIVFARSLIVGSLGEGTFLATAFLLIGGFTWFRFWTRSERAEREVEAGSGPRRAYLVGLGVLMAVVGAGALIATLVGVFQLILGVGGLSDNFPTTITLFVAAGAAAWHLLATYTRDRKLFETGEKVAPFDVTVVCSHPGMLATRFPDRARLRVVYRGDDLGMVDDEMADLIVSAVGTRSSYVWVDESGFRVAPAR